MKTLFIKRTLTEKTRRTKKSKKSKSHLKPKNNRRIQPKKISLSNLKRAHLKYRKKMTKKVMLLKKLSLSKIISHFQKISSQEKMKKKFSTMYLAWTARKVKITNSPKTLIQMMNLFILKRGKILSFQLALLKTTHLLKKKFQTDYRRPRFYRRMCIEKEIFRRQNSIPCSLGGLRF